MGIIKNKKGFSLIEGVLGTLLVASSVLGGVVAMQNSLLNTAANDRYTLGAQLANEKIEIILADKEYFGYDHVLTANNYPKENLNGAYSGFERQVQVSEIDGDDLSQNENGSGLAQVKVIVSWDDHNGEQQITLKTLIADYDFVNNVANGNE